MYSFFLRFFIFFSSILISPEIFSQITADITNGCAPLSVQFNAPAGATSYYWEFDDGSSSILPNPPNIFINPKNPYTVKFRTCKTCPVISTLDITVTTKPSITVPVVKGCAPLTTTLSPIFTLPTGITATSMKYFFGDGTSLTLNAPNLSQANHTYPKGSYPVTFELTTSPAKAGCDNTVTIPNAVMASELTPNFALIPAFGCLVPFNLSCIPTIIADRPIVSYLWDNGNGKTSTASNTSFIYNNYGSYSVSLIVKDDYGCEKTISKTIDIIENDMTQIQCQDTVCVNIPFTASHNGNNKLNTSWYFPGASGASGSNSSSSTAIYATPGVYTISVTTDVYGQCLKTKTKQLVVLDPKIEYTINPMPLCNRTNQFTLNCTNSSIFDKIYWIVNPFRDTISTSFNQNITYTIKDLDSLDWQYYKPDYTPVKLSLKIVAKTKFGCYVSTEKYDFIDPIIAHIAPNKTEGCAPLTVGFVDRTDDYRKDTIVAWKIDYGDGTIQTYTSFNDTIFHTYTTRGTYNVKMMVKNKYGCMDTTYITKINVGSPQTPNFTISPSGNLCASDTSQKITVSSTVSSSLVQSTKFWIDGFQCISQDNVTFSPKKTAGFVKIKMEVSDNGCFTSLTKTITMKGPIAKYVYTQFCDTPQKVVFTNNSQQATNYLWDFAGLDTSTAPNPTFYFPKDSTYKVTLTAYNNANTCPPSVYELYVQIQTPKAVLDKDTFGFCITNMNKKITAHGSSGYINDKNNAGFKWEYKKDIQPRRSMVDSILYPYASDTVTDFVFLTVRNFMNCESHDTALILVDRVDLYIIPAPTNPICSGDEIIFHGIVKCKYPDSTYKWNFGDGATADTLISKHNYIFPKTKDTFGYNLTVVNKLGCKNTIRGRLDVKKLALNLTTSSKNVCLGADSSRLIATSAYPTTKTWELPSTIRLHGDTIKQKFINTGTFPYTLYAIDKINSNCKDTLITAINVWAYPKLGIQSNKDNLSILCDPLSIELNYIDTNNTPLTTGSKKWILQNILGTVSYNLNNLSTPLTKGINTVTFSASTLYCADTAVRIFNVLAPSGEMTIDKNDLCKGDTIEFKVKNLVDVSKFYIDFGDGSLDSISPIKHKYTFVPISGKTIAKAIFATNGRACEGIPVEKEIRIYEVFAKFGIDFNSDTAICYRKIHIKDSSKGANSYHWDFGDGTTSSVNEPGSHLYPKADTFFISLSIENSQFGCKDTFSKNVILIPLPKSNPTRDTSCLGVMSKVFQTNPQKNVVFFWNPKNKFQLNPADTNYLKLDSSLVFSSIAFDTSSKCSDTAFSSIYIIQPMKGIVFDTIISPGADITLPFELIENYSSQWTPDSFLSCLNCTDPVAKYILNPIKYEVTFTEKIKNCFTGISKYNIRIFPDILVNAPTAFTPNGDGFNDIYYARGFGIKKLTSFKIYNRWGQLLFYSQDEKEGWDGYYKGELQNSDTYFYTIEGESFIKDKKVTKEGNFMLLK